MIERTAEAAIVDVTINKVFGYSFAELRDREAAATLTQGLLEEILEKGIILNPKEALRFTISHFDKYRNANGPSAYTRDQAVALNLAFGSQLDNHEVAEVMRKSFTKTCRLILEGVDIFNKFDKKDKKTIF